MAQGRKSSDSQAGRQDHVAGLLCLDFVNTVDWRGSLVQHERLVSYGDLLIWCGQVGLIRAATLAQLVALAVPDAAAATAVLRRAIALREAIHQLVQAARRSEPLPPGDLELLNTELASGPAHRQLVLRDGHAVWAHADTVSLDTMLAPLAQSAAELLTGDTLARVKQCGNADCGWLFLDLSRAQRRRWCSMDTCGNRAKARRHYRRQNALKDAPS